VPQLSRAGGQTRGEAPGTVGEEVSQRGAGRMHQNGGNQGWTITGIW